MEEISKSTIKLCKIVVKYIPILIAIGYFITSITSCLGVFIGFIVPIYRLSILSFICLFACSKLLKFCIWHRLPLYYSILIDVINAIDYYIVIPILSKWMILIYLLITGIFILCGVYLKDRYNRINRNSNV